MKRRAILCLQGLWVAALAALLLVMLGPSFVLLKIEASTTRPMPRLAWSTGKAIPVKGGTSWRLERLPHGDSQLLLDCAPAEHRSLADFSWGQSSAATLQMRGCDVKMSGRALRLGLGLFG